MNSRFYRTIFLCCVLSATFTSLNAQLELKLQLLSDGESWGVFIRPENTIAPSINTITGSAQVTVVMPVDMAWGNLQSESGLWANNATITGPAENPSMKYVSFGLVNAEPSYPIPLISEEETMLFSFSKTSGPCPDTMHLIDCVSSNSDPFCLPNSVSSNPGNDFSVIDFGVSPVGIYTFSGIYGPASWSCADNDGDGIPNGIEDTNGDGDFDPFDDDSDLNDPNDPGEEITGGIRLKLQLMPDGQSWGVYAKPNSQISPSGNTITYAGKVELVAPAGFVPDNVTSQSGTWEHVFTTESPQENQDRTYLRFELIEDEPQIVYEPGEETLLFTIHRSGNCPDSLNIMNESDDPVAIACMNGQGSECVFNELNVLDLGSSPSGNYFYDGSYGHSAWSCHDCDGDGILNAFEDTDGDGAWTPGVDGSQLCNPCDPIHPLSATLSYEGETTICGGVNNDPAYLSVAVEGGAGPTYDVSYTDGSAVFTIEDYTPGTAIDVFPVNGAVYQLISVTDNNDCPVAAGELSGIFEIQVDGPIEIVEDPSPVITCGGEVVSFNGMAFNPGPGDLIYQWQQSCDGGATWTDLVETVNISGALTSQLSISDTDVALSGCYFRLKARTPICGQVYSAAAELTIDGPAQITQQPIGVTTCAGEQACFTVEANNLSGGTVEYRWQAGIPGTPNWLNMGANPSYTGEGTQTLCIGDASGFNGVSFRVVVSVEGCTDVISETAAMVVDGPLSVETHPSDQAVNEFQDAQFHADISNQNFQSTIYYQWQQSLDGVTFWDMSNGALGQNSFTGVHSEDLLVSPVTGLDGTYYRLMAWSDHCGPVYTEAAALEEETDQIAFISEPEDRVLCVGSATQFAVEVQTSGPGQISYEWQMSLDSGPWEVLENNAVFNGAESAVLTVQDLSGLSGAQFRCRAKFATSDWITSGAASLTVDGPIAITAQPQSALVCIDEGHFFSAEVESGQAANVDLQWQISDDNGQSWVDLAEGQETGYGGVYEDVTSDKLAVSSVEGLDGYLYRLVVHSTHCDATSEAVMLSVNESPECFPAERFIDLVLHILPDGESWGVYMKAGENYDPSGYQMALSGRVTIVAESGFTYTNLISQAGGTWTPGAVMLGAPLNPNMDYFTFNLTPNNNSLKLDPGEEIMLFSIKKSNFCPQKMFLMSGYIPNGLQANEFVGIDVGNEPDEYFYLGGTEVGSIACFDSHNLMIVEGEGLAELEEGSGHHTPTSQAVVISDLPENETAVSVSSLTVYPNPTSGQLNIRIPDDLPEGTITHRILSASGAGLKQQTGSEPVDVSSLPSGLYFLTLEVDGVVLQRERFVKK